MGREFTKGFEALLLAVLLSGCAVGPDYVTPDTEVAPLAGANTEGFTADPVSATWWQSFKDETLDSLVDRAVKENKDLRGALARVNESRALRRLALLQLTPSIQTQAGYSKTLQGTTFFPGGTDIPRDQRTHEIYSGDIDATWEIDIFGRLRRSLEARTAEEQSSIASLQDVLRIVVSEVGRNYFELRGAQAQLEVARHNSDLQRDTVRLTETLASTGQSSELDAARARAQLASTLATIPPLEASVRASIHRLAVLVGQQPSALLAELQPVKPLPQYAGPVGLGDPAALLKRRPDIRAAERNLAAATAGIGVEEGGYFPIVTFNGSIGVQASTFSGLNNGAEVYSFGPNISWAAFDIGRVYARVKAAGARAEGALASYEQSVLTALEEAENALADFSAQRGRRDALRNAVTESERAVNLSQVRYKEGLTDFLTVLDAQRVLLVNQAELVRSETQLSVALVGVYKALGGGWEGVTVGKAPEEGSGTRPAVTPVSTNVSQSSADSGKGS